MRAIVVDDWLDGRKLMTATLEKISDVELAGSFGDAESALEFIKENQVDIILLDIKLPGMSGLELAHRMESLEEPPEIIFVTKYTEYALDAWNTNARAFVKKPFTQADIEKAISRCGPVHQLAEMGRKIEVRCFPGFDVFLDGVPIRFTSAKAKELLAYLVQNRGEWVKSEKLTYILFGEQEEKAAQGHLRVIFYRLRNTLKEYQVAELLETKFNQSRIRTEMFSCDFYRYLEGDRNEFQGEYLHDYSWGEPILSIMLQEYDAL